VLTAAPKAQALKKIVPEIKLVAVNLDDPATVRNAMKGAYGVYGVTDFWEHGYEREVLHGKTLVDAAKADGIKHFVWSTFDHSEINVPHFESKWEVDGRLSFAQLIVEYLKQSGVPRTSLYTAFYIENIREAMKMKREGDTYILPMTILPDGSPMMSILI